MIKDEVLEPILKIDLIKETELSQAAAIHQSVFARQKNSLQWLASSFHAFPRYLLFVAKIDEQVVGYISWAQKSGFRDEAVMELEQLAVMPAHQGQGIGRALISQSLPLIKQQLAKQGSVLKHIMVTTRADNHAQALYKSTLGAEVEAVIANLYSADEVLMIARNIP